MGQNLDIGEVYKLVEEVVLPGEEFCIKDLYRNIEWKRMSIDYRHRMGILFKMFLDSAPFIEQIGKNTQNSTIYRRK